MFATRRSRGAAVAAVCVGLVGGYAVADLHASAEVRRKQHRTKARLRDVLPRTNPGDLLLRPEQPLDSYVDVRQSGNDGGPR